MDDKWKLLPESTNPSYNMWLSLEEYSIATKYLASCIDGHINQPRLDLCRWIVEKVADGTITVGE